MRHIISYKHPEVQGGGLSLEEHSCFCSSYLPYCLFYSHFFPSNRILYVIPSATPLSALAPGHAECPALPLGCSFSQRLG